MPSKCPGLVSKNGGDEIDLFVTGAMEFMGSHLCESLISKGHKVYALKHISVSAISRNLMKNDDYHIVEGDILDSQKLAGQISDSSPDCIFHFAACVPRRNPRNESLYNKINAGGTLNVLEAAYMAGVKKLIYSSSIAVYNVHDLQYLPVDENHPTNTVDLYGLSKLTGESYCELFHRLFDMHIIILRYSSVFGPGREGDIISTLSYNALRGKALRLSTDIQSFDFVYISDAIQAALDALENVETLPCSTFNIGSGQETHLEELAQNIIDLTNSESKLDFGEKNRTIRFYVNIEKARKMLGFSPMPLNARIEEFIRWICRNKMEDL